MTDFNPENYPYGADLPIQFNAWIPQADYHGINSLAFMAIDLQVLLDAESNALFRQGDLLLWAEFWHGEDYVQILPDDDEITETLRVRMWVSLSVPPQNRRVELSWSHHKVIAAQASDVQQALLEECITYESISSDERVVRVKKLSVADLRVMMKDIGLIEQPPDAPRDPMPSWVKAWAESMAVQMQSLLLIIYQLAPELQGSKKLETAVSLMGQAAGVGSEEIELWEDDDIFTHQHGDE